MSIATNLSDSKLDLSFLYNRDLLNRVFFTFFALIIYRLGTYIPIPGINPDVIDSVVSKNSVGVIGMFNLFSGGALGRMTVLALNVMPYIVSSIVMQLLSISSSKLSEIKQEGDLGRVKMNYYIRYMTILFSLVQGMIIIFGLEKMNDQFSTVVINPGFLFRMIGVSTLLGGTMFLVWLGERITSNGIGNGVSLIIFTGIISELPGSLSSVILLGKNGGLSVIAVLSMVILLFLLLILIIFIERSFRKVPVHYPKRQIKNRLYNHELTYIPLKINMSGVIPPIFSNAVLLFPVTVASFHKNSIWSNFIFTYFSSGKLLYVVLYIILIVFFSFFYVYFVFSVEETSNLLKKNGGFISGVRPGKNTSDYFRYTLQKLTVIGSCYLVIVCVVPEVMRYYYTLSFTLGGTSFLIIVNVLMDVLSQIQTYVYHGNYSSLIKKAKLWKIR